MQKKKVEFEEIPIGLRVKKKKISCNEKKKRCAKCTRAQICYCFFEFSKVFEKDFFFEPQLVSR